MHLNLEEARELYSQILEDDLPPEKDHFLLKRRFEVLYHDKLMGMIKNSIKESYIILFDLEPKLKKIIKKPCRFFYCPSSKIVDSKYKFWIGCDSHFYGWNIVGDVLNDLFFGNNAYYDKYWIYYTFKSLEFLDKELKSGNDILEYSNMFSFDIYYKIFGHMEVIEPEMVNIVYKFKKKELPFMQILLFEFENPKNMIFLLRMHTAPVINYSLNKKIIFILKNWFISKLQKTTHKKLNSSLDAAVIDKIVKLYRDSKLELDDDSSDKINACRGKIWTRHKIIMAISTMPCTIRHEQYKAFVFGHDDQQISPLFHSHLIFENKKFLSVLHLAYFKIFLKLGMDEHDAYHLICKDGCFIDFQKCDVDYQIENLIFNKSKSILYGILERKIKDNEYQLFNHHHNAYLGDDYLAGPVCMDILSNLKQSVCLTKPWLKKKHDFLVHLSAKNCVYSYYDYFSKILHICDTELGFVLTLKNIKNIFKVMLPSIYILYKNYDKRHDFIAKFNSELDDECNEFLFMVLQSIDYYYSKISKKLARNIENIFDTIYKLYKLCPKKGSSTLDSIHKMMVKTTDPVLDREVYTKNIKDLDLCKQISNLSLSIYYNDTFYNL
jgi:hypothetical protein